MAMITYDAVLKDIGTNGARSHLLFETFVLALLGEHLRTHDRRLLTERTQVRSEAAFQFRPDAIAPDGVGDLPGPTLVDVKYRPFAQRAVGTGVVAKIVGALGAAASATGCRSVLLILGEALPGVVRQQIAESAAARWQEQVPLEIWDAGQLRKLVEEHESFVVSVLPQIGRIRLERAVSEAEAARREPHSRDELIAKIRAAFADGDLALFLGAGVSMDAGVPSWNALLEVLLVRLVDGSLRPAISASEDEIDDVATRLRLSEMGSPLLAARYVRRGLEDLLQGKSDSFVDEVTRALYRKLPTGGAPSRLLQTVAELARPRRSGPKVRSVVTYNFDDLLERALDRCGVQHRSIFSEGVVAGRDELPVHHVHGFLPRDRSRYPSIDTATWAFSEEGYHHLFADPYHWSNLVQLNSLREQRCLLIGLSLADPNLRRLLEIASKRNGAGRHVAILRRTSRADLQAAACAACRTSLPASTTRVEVLDSFTARHEALHEALLQELGLDVLWVDEFGDIPGLLRAISA